MTQVVFGVFLIKNVLEDSEAFCPAVFQSALKGKQKINQAANNIVQVSAPSPPAD